MHVAHVSIAAASCALDRAATEVASVAPAPLGQLRMLTGSTRGDQLVLLPIFNFTYTAEQRHFARAAQRAPTRSGRWMLVALTSRDRGRRRGVDRAREEPDRPGRARDGARRSARQHPRPRRGTAMSSTSLDLHFGDSGRFWYSMSATQRLASRVVILLLRAFLTRKDRQGRAQGDYRTCVKPFPPS